MAHPVFLLISLAIDLFTFPQFYYPAYYHLAYYFDIQSYPQLSNETS